METKKEDTQMSKNRIIEILKKATADWKRVRLEKAIRRKKEELQTLRREKDRKKIELAGLELDLQKLIRED